MHLGYWQGTGKFVVEETGVHYRGVELMPVALCWRQIPEVEACSVLIHLGDSMLVAWGYVAMSVAAMGFDCMGGVTGA